MPDVPLTRSDQPDSARLPARNSSAQGELGYFSLAHWTSLRTSDLSRLAHSVLHYQRMRFCFVTLLAFFLAACGLSMNPDLPSTKENAPPLGGGAEGPNEGGDDGIAVGDGDPSPPISESPLGTGGVVQACLGAGGAGGAPTCGEGP